MNLRSEWPICIMHMSSMVRWLPVTILAFGLLLGADARAKPGFAELAERLKSGTDFRVRVQAALELGRPEKKSLGALVLALDDPHASVRAAAAAALKMLGD